jgi:hypothetical protein
MDGATRWARDRGCHVVRLRTSDAGVPLYASLGFRATQELELSLRPPANDAN